MKWLVCQIWTTRFRVKPASTQGPNTHVGFMTSPTRRFSGTQRSDGSSVRVNWNCLLNSILSAQNFFCWLIHLSWLKLHSCWLNHVDSTLLLIKCELFLSRTFPGLDGKCTLKSEIWRWNHGFVVFHPFKKNKPTLSTLWLVTTPFLQVKETWCPPRELGQTKCYLRYTQLKVIVLLNVLILSF